MARRLLLIAITLLLVLPANAMSVEDAGNTSNTGKSLMAQGMDAVDGFLPSQHFSLDPYIYTYAGYRFVTINGSGKAAEYEYLHSSVAGGLKLRYYPLPHRLDVDFEYLNKNDHNGELAYAYKDILKLDIRSTELFHNLNHHRFLDALTTDTDSGRLYGIDVNDRVVSFRIKPIPSRHDYIYARAREYTKAGDHLQRWMQGIFSGKVGQPRDIDWVTRELTAGISGNIYNVAELDYHFDYKEFKSRNRSHLIDTILGNLRGHNLVPETETWMHTVMLHTNQTWPVTASATGSIGHKENKFSGAEVDFHRESGDITATPTDNLLIAVKYGHERLDVDNPDTITDLNYTVIPVPQAVSRDSLTTERNKGVVAIRYFPLTNLNLLLQYELDAVDRTNDKNWNNQAAFLLATKSSSVKHTGKFSVNYRPMRHTRVRGGVEYAYNGDPSYDTDLEKAVKAFFWTTWVPTPGLTFNLQYNGLRGRNSGTSSITNAGLLDRRDRKEERDHAGAGVTWLASNGLVLGAHYDYLRHKIRTNIIFETQPAGDVVFSYATPYWDVSHGYVVFADYCFSFPLKLHADVGQTWTKGLFALEETLTGPLPTTLTTTGLADITYQRVRQLKANVKFDWEIFKGWGISGGYGLSRFRDLADRIYTDAQDGTAHFGMAMLTKRW